MEWRANAIEMMTGSVRMDRGAVHRRLRPAPPGYPFLAIWSVGGAPTCRLCSAGPPGDRPTGPAGPTPPASAP